MKTRAMKKVLSVVCVLALLMSVCVVGLVGNTSAAATYTLNINGVNQTINLETGAAIPDPTTPYEFLGWYDSLKFDTKVETAGDAKTLYAKFSSTVLNFDGADCFYSPNGVQSGFTVVTDPTNSSNKVLKAPVNNSRNNFGVPVYAGLEEGYTLENDQQYEVTFRYYVKSTGTTEFTKCDFSPMTCLASGIGQSGGSKNQNYKGYVMPVNGGVWDSASFIMKGNGITADNKYLVFSTYIGDTAGYKGEIYIDDIVITPIDGNEKTYTYYNKGVVSTATAKPGDKLPDVRGAAFLGWYDKSLNYKYTTAPATTTELYAVFSKNTYTFEDGVKDIYDPLNNFATNGQAAIVEDTDGNKAIKFTSNGANRFGFAVAGAIGANGGYKLQKGKVYKVSFKYKATGGDINFYATATAGVGANSNKKALGWKPTITKTDEWTLFEGEYTVPSDVDVAAMPYLYITSYSDTNGNYVMLDDLTISLKAADASTDPVYMDFEDKNGEGFKWSEADANNYTVSSGNGYVNRGEIVEEDGNKYFRVKHFLKRNANIYFTINDGTKQFKMVNYGLYTLKFDYKVEHSETPSKLGLVYVIPTTASTGLKYKTITVFDEFENRDDTGWTTIEYTFGADLREMPEYTSLGLYIFNSTNVPETDVDQNNKPTATSVLFDNIEVITHSATQEDGLIAFDSLGGTECAPIVGIAGEPVGTLPEPEKYGYVFKGWKYDVVNADETVTSYDLTAETIMPDFVTEAYAVWELAEGVVEFTFRSNVAEYDANAPVLVAFPGQPILGFPEVNPTSTASEFLGWYYDRAFTKPVDPKCAIAESSTIFAKWSNAGTKVDFENYPTGWFDKKTGQGKMGQVTDRVSIKELEDGNHVFFYDFSKGSNQSNTSSITGAILHTGTEYVTAVEGIDYTVTFKYKVLEAKAQGSIGVILSGSANSWTNRSEQTQRINYGKAEDKWLEASFTFNALYAADSKSNNNFISIGVSNDCKIYIDDIVVTSSINSMNIYGTAVVFNTNGGKALDPISGDVGTELKLPTPVRPGYKFIGWYTDKALTQPLTQKTYGEEQLFVYAKWQLGKFTESFEDYPANTKLAGVAGAYSFYNSKTAGYDKANVHDGETALFRSGATAGNKAFTCMRTADLALKVGDTYTIEIWVKPTSISDANGTISMIDMAKFTSKDTPLAAYELAKVGELKEGEWNKITYTFTAKAEFVGISTSANNDMYIDDITITLKGYSGSATGDSSVNPIVVIALIILSAGALLITGKKVYSK